MVGNFGFKKIRITARKGKEGSNITRLIRDNFKSNKVLCHLLHLKVTEDLVCLMIGGIIIIKK